MTNTPKPTESAHASGLTVDVNAMVSDDKPWDVKSVKIMLGGEDDDKGSLVFEIFDDKSFNIYDGDPHCEEHPKWFKEDIDLDAARRLRDFLNYAVR